jgi:hypothetical protein
VVTACLVGLENKLNFTGSPHLTQVTPPRAVDRRRAQRRGAMPSLARLCLSTQLSLSGGAPWRTFGRDVLPRQGASSANEPSFLRMGSAARTGFGTDRVGGPAVHTDPARRRDPVIVLALGAGIMLRRSSVEASSPVSTVALPIRQSVASLLCDRCCLQGCAGAPRHRDDDAGLPRGLVAPGRRDAARADGEDRIGIYDPETDPSRPMGTTAGTTR